MTRLYEEIQKTYKKLKAEVYFDKTALILREQIVDFEVSLEAKLFMLYDALLNEEKWDKYKENLLSSIEAIEFPKKLKHKNNMPDAVGSLINNDEDKLEVENSQFFIKADVEAHILGVLWIIKIGRHLYENGDISILCRYYSGG